MQDIKNLNSSLRIRKVYISKPILIGKNKVRFSKAKIDEWLLNGGLGGEQNV